MSVIMTGRAEVPLYGVDGEIGGRLPLASGNSASLGVYGGGFWFDHDDIEEAVAGGIARVELAFNDVAGPGSRLSAEYRYTDDKLGRGTSGRNVLLAALGHARPRSS